MDHFYPYNAASESDQLGYERLTTDKLTALFMAFIWMAILALGGLAVEILFDKVKNKKVINAVDIVKSDVQNYQVRFILSPANDTTYNTFRQQLDIFLRDFSAHSVDVIKIK
jgi:hypothetical protein